MEPSSQDLPFVLVYGPWIWKLGLVVLVAIVFGLVTALRYLAERRRLRDVVARMERHDIDHVIRGKLGGEGAATLFVGAPYADTQRACWRADSLWVDTADGRVALEGEIVVEAGTHCVATRRHLPHMPDALRERAQELPLVGTNNWSVTRLVRVAEGDEVFVRGKLVNAPGHHESTFREAPLVMTLTATASDPIVLAARAPQTAVPRMALFRMALLAGVTMFAGYKVAGAIGEHAREGCWSDKRYENVRGFVELSGSDRCIRIAAFPGQQKRTYGTLFNALESHPHRDERSLARLAYLAKEGGYEGSFLYLLDNTGRLDDLLTFARLWHEPRREQDALYALGRYEEGIAVPGGEPASLEVLIAANRWSDAARSVEATARYFESQKNEDPQTAHIYTVAARQKRCLAHLFDHYAGVPSAFAELHILAADDAEHVCLPMLIESEPPSERVKRLSTMDIWSERHDVKRLLRAQAQLEGLERFELPFEHESPASTLVALDETVRSDGIKALWVSRLSPVPVGDTRAAVLGWHAAAKVLDGHADEAMQLASQIDNAGTLKAAIALYTPSTTSYLAHAFDDRGLLHEHRRLILRAKLWVADFPYAHDVHYSAALVAAQQGDGTELANLVATTKWWELGDVLAVLPHVKQGRDELRDQLVWNAQYGSWRSSSPFDLASTAAVRRDLFRLANDTPRAAYWDAIYQRVAKVFDRKRLMALLLSE